MELGLHVSDFTWPGGAQAIGPTLVRIARDAEDAGFARLSVMDHFWQIGNIGPPEHEMLEAYTALGFLAAHTTKITLNALVTGWATALDARQPSALTRALGGTPRQVTVGLAGAQALSALPGALKDALAVYQYWVPQISRPMSSTRAEWVSAPTEM